MQPRRLETLVHIKFIVMLAATLGATTAQAFTAINGLMVNPVPGAGRFEVVASGSDGPRQIWCAAAQFAVSVQGLRGNHRVYIAQGYGPSQTAPGYRGVIFTTQPTGDLSQGPRPGTGGDYSVSIRKTGFNLGTGHAIGFCDDVYDEISDRWPW